MSELRVALIAEGPTDAIIIEAALKAILGRPFILQTLQPEAAPGPVGTGWCGVFKWCRSVAQRGVNSLEGDPTLPGFDLFVLHLDADVAEKSYADGGSAVEEAAEALLSLPCKQPCPPAAAAADEVRRRLVEWLGLKQVGPRTVVCIPSKAIDAWLATGVLDDGHALLTGIECNLRVEAQRAALPLNQRIRKARRDYLRRETAVTREWERIRKTCTQAELFHHEIRAAVAFANMAADAMPE
jgi:hypothetical protein